MKFEKLNFDFQEKIVVQVGKDVLTFKQGGKPEGENNGVEEPVQVFRIINPNPFYTPWFQWYPRQYELAKPPQGDFKAMMLFSVCAQINCRRIFVTGGRESNDNCTN